ncbi:hypothetical protein QJQ45_000272 [Haematococcus lacustris]|nr:hypothetical protein QJQ45_000272 [Haematococcus lacustris]
MHLIKLDSRVLHGVCKQLGLTKETMKPARSTIKPARSQHCARWFSTGKLANRGFEFEGTVEKDAPDEQREFVFDPATQVGVGIDPGVTQAVSAASGLQKEMAEVAMKRQGRAKQLVVFFNVAGIGTRGSWGADAVLRACCKVVCWPRGIDQLRGRVVLVDEHRTSRVSSAVNGQQPCESRLSKRRETRPAGWKPPAGQVEQHLLRPAWSQQRDQPVRGMMWCPGALPAKGKYPELGYKRLRDKPPKAQQEQQQQQQSAVAQ